MDLQQYLSDPSRTAKELAEKIGVPAPLLSQWRTGVRPVPAEHCPKIERETSGAVRCEDLRPDVDWAYLRATNCDTPKSNAVTGAAIELQPG